MEPDPRPALPHQPGLDGLRGLAIAAVLAFHLGIELPGGRTLSGGFLGVSLFFTLSGVLIGVLMLGEIGSSGRFSITDFWARRARRLVPAALVVLAAIAAARPLTATLEATSGGDLVAAAFNVANWRFVATEASYADLFAGPSAVLHFWSLAIEAQLYVALAVGAAALAVFTRRPVRAACILAGAGAAASFLLPVVAGMSTDRTYYGTDTRAGELLIGIVAAAVLVDPTRRRRILAGRGVAVITSVGAAALGVTAALWVLATPSSETVRRGLLPLTAALSVAVILAALAPTGPVAAISAARPLRWLGRISYGAYLIHWPVIVVADRVTADRSLLRHAIVVAITLVLAQASSLAVELPVRRRRWSPRPVLAAAGMLIAAIGVTATHNGRQSTAASYLADLSAATGQASAPDASPPAGSSPAGESTPTGEVPHVGLFGDSIGFSLLLAMGDAEVEPRFERVTSDVALGCGIAVSPAPPPDEPGRCDDPAGRYAALAAAADIDVAVMISCQWELVEQPLPGLQSPLLQIGDAAIDRFVALTYRDIADRLAEVGVARILWTRCPYLSASIGVDGLSDRLLASRDPARVDRLNELIDELAAERDDVEVLPFDEWVNAHGDDRAIRPDGSHFAYGQRNPAADAWIGLINSAL